MPRARVVAALCLSLIALGSPAPAAHADPASNDGVVAYVTDRDGDSEIYALDLGDGTEENLTVHPGEDASPTWSTSGTDLAFVSDRSGVSSLYVSPLDGRDPVLISESENLDWSWSLDEGRIAWVDHSVWKDLWVTDLETGSTINLTGGTREVWGPSWSPDDRFIIFVSVADGGYFDIFRIPAAGGTAVNLTANQTANDFNPQWSPDGGHIAFVSQRDGFDALYVMDADGTNPRFLTDDPGDEPCPRSLGSLAWSPDGSRLAYAATLVCGSPIFQSREFYVIDMDGGLPYPLLAGGANRSSGPSWSPDGAKLAVVTGAWSNQDLTVVDADGGNLVSLTALVGTGSTRSPAWSLDGSRLAFVADPQAGQRALPPPPMALNIYVVDAQGSNLELLTAGTDPAWKPDPRRGVGLVDPASGLWQLEGQPAFYFGVPGDLPVLGDWNCDGVETPGLFRPSSGFAYVRNSRDTGVADMSFFFGMRGDIPLAGDWDGDGCDSLGIYRRSIGKVFLRNSLDTGFADIEYFFGIPGDRPFVGDFDGDGVDELGLYRQTTGLTYLRMDHHTGIADVEFFFGVGGDHIISGDWDRDGTDTVGVFRPLEHKFYLRNDNSTGFADHEFWRGQSHWLPVAESAE